MAEIGVFTDPQEEYLQYDEDSEVLILYMPPDEFKTEIREAEKIAKRTKEDVNSILLPRIAKKNVKGWRKITDHTHPGIMVGGQPLEFSEANLMLLVKKSYEFRNFINEYITNERVFLELAKARAAKNS